MISILEYNKDSAHVHLRCRITRVDSQQEFAYEVHELISEFDTIWPEQFTHLLPSTTTEWCISEEEARGKLIKLVCDAFDAFSTWPQYTDHAYLPGEVYEGDEVPHPPGSDIFADK